MRIFTLFGLLGLFLLASVMVSKASPDKLIDDKTYFLGVSACPGWNISDLPGSRIAGSCKTTLKEFTNAMRSWLHIPSKNVFTLLNQEATSGFLQKMIKKVRKRISSEGRFILYLNVHGPSLYGVEVGKDRENPEATQVNPSETLILWSKDKPSTVISAVAYKYWITMGQLKSLLDTIDAAEKIVILDANYAGVTIDDLKTNYQGEAIIVAAGPKQVAHFTEDFKESLFSQIMVDQIKTRPPNFKAAFEEARVKTHVKSEKICTDPYFAKRYPEKQCLQMPEAYDPRGVLLKVR